MAVKMYNQVIEQTKAGDANHGVLNFAEPTMKVTQFSSLYATALGHDVEFAGKGKGQSFESAYISRL